MYSTAQEQFKTDLAFSQSDEVTTFWRSAHEAAFADFVDMEEVTDLTGQSVGLDRVIYTAFQQFYVEEKVDNHKPVNFCFELEGSYGNKGWCFGPQLSQVFAVGYIKYGKAYYFDTAALFDTFGKMYGVWYDQYPPVRIAHGSALVMLVPLSVVCELVRHRVISL